jgi:hypothetical protein
MLLEGEQSDEAMIRFAVRRGRGYLRKGGLVVAAAGRAGEAGSTNVIRVVTADE